jgi:RecB family exonuclease
VKGRYLHAILEHLFREIPAERTIERARTFFGRADESVLTDEVKADLDFSENTAAKLRAETEALLEQYFAMEDPTTVRLGLVGDAPAVELALDATIDDAPLYGILDRLDEDADGNLVIVDYKTGATPRPDYENEAFANAAIDYENEAFANAAIDYENEAFANAAIDYENEAFANAAIYVALCEARLQRTPVAIRLLYVASGVTLERLSNDVFPSARTKAATQAWGRIRAAYGRGNFVPTPSPRNCRFCPEQYKALCRADGVSVPEGRR